MCRSRKEWCGSIKITSWRYWKCSQRSITVYYQIYSSLSAVKLLNKMIAVLSVHFQKLVTNSLYLGINLHSGAELGAQPCFWETVCSEFQTMAYKACGVQWAVSWHGGIALSDTPDVQKWGRGRGHSLNEDTILVLRMCQNYLEMDFIWSNS